MAIERPTFSESWYRICQLRPRLRPSVQIHRQHYRGRMWHVLQDPASNQFYRLNDAAYRFVALLDGRRTIADVWQTCNEQFGDDAPTQGEAIQLLGQLYTSNLLQGEMPPDAGGLLKRYRQRVSREVRGYLMNLLFIRIPLYDPNQLLNRWVSVVGKLFTMPVFILWLILIGTGLYFAFSNWEHLGDQTSSVLNPENLPLLYVAFAAIKLVHEFGHAFACKRFGRLEGSGGDVHTIGIMFLVFTPLPYVDASSAWAFRSKWHRVVVGSAGMLVELAVAAGAAIVWANTAPGTTIHALTYNMMFVASVSTLLFNGNPLLRYDAYYILSDLIEVPNLSQRSKQYIYYLVKKYVWGVRHPRNPAHTRGEKGWFFFYGIASTIYRVFICVRILMFVANKLFFVGAVLAVVAVVAWVLVPLGKFIHYLATSGELFRCRPRAVGTTVAFAVTVLVLIGLLHFPERGRVEGVVDWPDMAAIYAEGEGEVTQFVPDHTPVKAGEVLIRLSNPELERQLRVKQIEREGLIGRRKLARQRSMAQAQIIDEQIRGLDKQIEHLREQLAKLETRAPIDGLWIAPKIEQLEGFYLQRGTQLGLVADVDNPLIRAPIGQNDAEVLYEQLMLAGNEEVRQVEIRLKGRPPAFGDDREAITGVIEQIYSAGSQQLPSRALSHAAGGPLATDPSDQEGTRATEHLLTALIRPEYDPNHISLLREQRVVIRYSLPEKPLIQQWYRQIYQLVQQRFQG